MQASASIFFFSSKPFSLRRSAEVLLQRVQASERASEGACSWRAAAAGRVALISARIRTCQLWVRETQVVVSMNRSAVRSSHAATTLPPPCHVVIITCMRHSDIKTCTRQLLVL